MGGIIKALGIHGNYRCPQSKPGGGVSLGGAEIRFVCSLFISQQQFFAVISSTRAAVGEWSWDCDIGLCSVDVRGSIDVFF